MSRRVLFVLAALVVVTPASAGAAAPERGDVPRARELMEAGRRAEAATLVDALLEASPPLRAPDRAAARWLRALLTTDGAEYEKRLLEVLAEDGGDVYEGDVRLALGEVAFAQGRLEKAVAEFRRAREAGRREEAGLWLGLTAFALGDAELATSALTEAAASSDEALRARAFLALGNTYRAASRWEDAARAYRQAQEAGGGWEATALYLEATCRLESGDEEEAGALLSALLRRWPGSYEAPAARQARARLAPLVPAGATEAEPSAPAPGAASPPGDAYCLQVGAFRVSENAEALATSVREAGFGPVDVVTGEDGLVRVFVGRFPERAAAENAGDSLATALSVGFSVISPETH